MPMTVRKPMLASLLLITAVACSRPTEDQNAEHITAAERYFRGMYSSDTTVVDALIADDITISYPIFQQLFGTPTIHGRDSVKAVVIQFASSWTEPKVEFDETIAEGDRVVLVWSFRARNVGAVGPDQPADIVGAADAAGGVSVADRAGVGPDQPADSAVHSWGGITLIRFDADGKIVEELGEESDPGPTARMRRALPS